MINRRTFLSGIALGTLSAPLAAGAPQAANVARIGYLSPMSPKSEGLRFLDSLRQSLQERGYLDGQNITIEARWANGSYDRLPDLAMELVRLKVDVIVSMVTAASLAAKNATGTIPIVMVGVADPVDAGLVSSIARPGGNVTGTSSVAAEVAGKQLELLRDIVPGVSRVAVLWNPANLVFQTLQLRQTEAAAHALGLRFQVFDARSPNDFDPAFTAMAREGHRALVVLVDNMFGDHWARIAERAAKNRLPAISGGRGFAEASGLMAYGPSYSELHKRAAYFVDRVLKGTKPADLPVEQPTKFELVINLKTAKALGLTIPQSILVRADEIIQ